MEMKQKADAARADAPAPESRLSEDLSNSLGSNETRLRLRHLAGRVVRPVAIEADHAPLDTPAGADHPGVLGDRVVDGMLAAVGDLDDPATEAARNAVGRPGAERGLADPFEIDDPEIGDPVH